MTNKKEISDNDLSKVSGGVGAGDVIIDDEFRNKVIRIIVEQLDLNLVEITTDLKLVTDLGVDFLDIIDLIQQLEEQFKIRIDESSFFALVTIEDIIKYVHDRCTSK